MRTMIALCAHFSVALDSPVLCCPCRRSAGGSKKPAVGELEVVLNLGLSRQVSIISASNREGKRGPKGVVLKTPQRHKEAPPERGWG